MHTLRDFEHRPGKHCSSTALADVMRYHGHGLSEAVCFGLGAGLGFVYFENPRGSPSLVLGSRTPALEWNFFRNLGLPFDWRAGDDFPWPQMREYLDRDVPLLLLTDLYYLPHYGKSVHFPGHSIVLAGYEGDVALVADTAFPDLMPVPLDDLAAAMDVPLPPIPIHNNWFPVERFALPDLGDAIRRALVANARAMLQPAADSLGLPGMRLAVTRLPRWGQAEDWQWCARFGYQIIERRGTGGGGFRLMYADFLDTASGLLPALVEMDAPARMRQSAAGWTALGDNLKAISESESPSGFERAAAMLARIAEQEESFYRDIVQVLGKNPVSHAVERILEDESLTADLVDAAARVLLDWGVARAQKFESADLRRTMKRVNREAGKAAPEAQVERVRALLAEIEAEQP